MISNVKSKNINEFIEQFKHILSSNDILKICYDSKQEMYFYKQFGIEINNYFDCSVAKYLVDGVPVDSVRDIFFDDDFKFFDDFLMYKKRNCC